MKNGFFFTDKKCLKMTDSKNIYYYFLEESENPYSESNCYFFDFLSVKKIPSLVEQNFYGCDHSGAVQVGLELKKWLLDSEGKEIDRCEGHNIKGIPKEDKEEFIKTKFKTLCGIDPSLLSRDNSVLMDIPCHRVYYSSPPTYIVELDVFVRVKDVQYHEKKISCEVVFTEEMIEMIENEYIDDEIYDELFVVILRGNLEIKTKNGEYSFERKDGLLVEKSDILIRNLLKMWS